MDESGRVQPRNIAPNERPFEEAHPQDATCVSVCVENEKERLVQPEGLPKHEVLIQPLPLLAGI